MNRLALLCMLLLVLSTLSAELAWQQPVTVRNFDNIQYQGQSLQTADGCHLIQWWANDFGIAQYFLRLYDQQYQPLWDAPLRFPGLGLSMKETSDSGFVLSMGIRVLKISRSGEFLWGPLGISLQGSQWTDLQVYLETDMLGGVYVVWSGGNYPRRSAIQHIDASGNISMASNGVLLENGADTIQSNLMILPDNSVLVGWGGSYTLKIQRMNSSGQFIWPQAVSIASSIVYPRGVFCAFSDASFAFCVSHGDSLAVQRYDHAGNAMWPQAVTALTASNIYSYSLKTARGSDNSVFVIAVGNYNDEYLQKISADGIVQFPGGIGLSAGLGYLDWVSSPLPDDSGGCTVVALANPNIKAIQISAVGNVAVYAVTNTAFSKQGLSAGKSGYSFWTEWQEINALQSGVKVQILDQQFQPQLDQNGTELIFGNAGLVQYVQTAARENGSSVIWQQSPLKSTLEWDLYLQIYNSQGQPLLDAGGIKVNRTGSSCYGENLVRCIGNQTMVVWGDQIGNDRGMRYQIYDPTGNILLPEGGVAFGSTNITFMNLSTHMGYWYLIWSSSNAIWGQKISGTQALWGNGIQLTQPHPENPDNIKSLKLDWPWLTWTLGWVGKPMFARIDENGTIQPGFPAYGIGLPVQDGQFLICKHTFTVCGDNLHVVLDFYQYYEEFTYELHKHTLINPQGEHLFPLTELPILMNYNVFTNNDDVYIGDYYNSYVIRKYNTSGGITDTYNVPMVGWQYGGWDVASSKILPSGDLLMLVHGFQQGSASLRHFFVSPQWELNLPADNIVFPSGIFPSVSMLGDRAWMATAAGRDSHYQGTAGVFLQGVGIGISMTPEDPQAPALPHLESCVPNPFNPSTTIAYVLPQAARARITVYDLRGRRIRLLLDSDMPVGKHSLNWDGKNADGKDLASGVYILLLEAAGKRHSRKVTLIK